MLPMKEFLLLCFEMGFVLAEEAALPTMPYNLTKKEVRYADKQYNHEDMLDFVLSIVLTIAALGAIFLVCCYCMSRSDKRLQNYVLALARRRGRKLEEWQLECPPQSQSPIAESCPVLLAEAGIIVP